MISFLVINSLNEVSSNNLVDTSASPGQDLPAWLVSQLPPKWARELQRSRLQGEGSMRSESAMRNAGAIAAANDSPSRFQFPPCRSNWQLAVTIVIIYTLSNCILVFDVKLHLFSPQYLLAVSRSPSLLIGESCELDFGVRRNLLRVLELNVPREGSASSAQHRARGTRS